MNLKVIHSVIEKVKMLNVKSHTMADERRNKKSYTQQRVYFKKSHISLIY